MPNVRAIKMDVFGTKLLLAMWIGFPCALLAVLLLLMYGVI